MSFITLELNDRGELLRDHDELAFRVTLDITEDWESIESAQVFAHALDQYLDCTDIFARRETLADKAKYYARERYNIKREYDYGPEY